METELKPLVRVATSLADLKEFPDEVRRVIGYALYLAQAGQKHLDAKPLKGFGVKLAGVVYVLHAFQKKSKQGIKTPQSELDKVKARLRVAEELHRTAMQQEESDERK